MVAVCFLLLFSFPWFGIVLCAVLVYGLVGACSSEALVEGFIAIGLPLLINRLSH